MQYYIVAGFAKHEHITACLYVHVHEHYSKLVKKRCIPLKIQRTSTASWNLGLLAHKRYYVIR